MTLYYCHFKREISMFNIFSSSDKDDKQFVKLNLREKIFFSTT